MSSRIIRTYFAITGLFNLAMSLIWGIDTLFKMGAGLDIQQVLLTNAAFTLGSMIFEIPTGVVADTLGRRVSLLLCLVTLFTTTLLYVASAWRGWDFGRSCGSRCSSAWASRSTRGRSMPGSWMP